ncbi:hypothetical protein BOTBODRAFT_171849 [Botryobasidium botryosum FD-172 SS1]|uniref:Protein kinase domain-containing protein n=1 Tax=Botryobasidium botryosum (strain FD-172 SS1) TaxID=930990 RepID=A0A067N202_BOTB1|nr:hypothetical protein BOTBODRAFT_171849 [Botryobasidium botryosum FD-172 SS1]
MKFTALFLSFFLPFVFTYVALASADVRPSVLQQGGAVCEIEANRTVQKLCNAAGVRVHEHPTAFDSSRPRASDSLWGPLATFQNFRFHTLSLIQDKWARARHQPLRPTTTVALHPSSSSPPLPTTSRGYASNVFRQHTSGARPSKPTSGVLMRLLSAAGAYLAAFCKAVFVLLSLTLAVGLCAVGSSRQDSSLATSLPISIKDASDSDNTPKSSLKTTSTPASTQITTHQTTSAPVVSPLLPKLPSPLTLAELLSTSTLDDVLGSEDLSKRYNLVKKLGAGSYGEVHLGINNGNGRQVAVKKLKLDSGSNRWWAMSEIVLMREAKHPNIVSFLASSRPVSTEAWVVMEFMAGGTVRDFIRRAVLEESHIAKICLETCKGLAYLHERNVVHRDIKCLNILIGADGEVKIADLGACAVLTESRPLCLTPAGTKGWMADEVQKNLPYGVKADIWSLGVLASTMKQHMVRSSGPESVHEDGLLQDFIAACKRKDVAKRPTAAQLLQHPFFKRACTAEHLILDPISAAAEISQSEDIDLGTSSDDTSKTEKATEFHDCGSEEPTITGVAITARPNVS